MSLLGVYEISKLLTAPVRLEGTLSRVLQLLSSFMQMRHGLIALLNSEGNADIVVGAGWSEATAKRYFDRLPERAIGRIVATKMPLVIERMKHDPLFESWDFSEWQADENDSSFIGVPIRDRGEVIGTLTIDREHANVPYFTFDEDVRFLTMIANLLGQTVRLQRLIARDRERLMGEQHRLEKAIEHTVPPERQTHTCGIIGNTPVIRTVLDKVKRVARSHSNVLLRGESGTGKELFAKALHDMSPRRAQPFVAVNCAALAESVLESELFGHEKGAFTGALTQRKGRFEMAHGGTLFLDEIGEISAPFQAKLLRVLQLGEFERLGGSQTIKVDVRLVAATNRNLEEAVAKGDFRADLYYRINVVPIFLPALRERKGDIPVLAREFLNRFNKEHGIALSLTDSAMAVLTSCYFPGNVRELENCVRRTATLANGSRIVADDFACRHDECMSAMLWKRNVNAGSSIALPFPQVTADTPLSPHAPAVAETPDAMVSSSVDSSSYLADSQQDDEDAAPFVHDESERDRLVQAMETAGWVQAKAARLLGLTPRQIGYALRKYDIPVKKF